MADSEDEATSAAPRPKAAPGRTASGARKASAKTARTRAREFALQALYQHLVGQQEAVSIDHFTRELSGFHKADSAHYDALLHGCIREAAEMDALITPRLDRPLAEISPIEHAVMWMGVYEFRHCLEVPWRVVINECIELAKDFGGTDGHKYVNAVLNALAAQWRATEVQADKAAGRARG
jgi:N utilization substance protein B